jgi:putative phosphoribosyl transferase
MFRNRIDGGEQLATQLKKYEKDPLAIVLGLPRGGVVTAWALAKGLHLPLDILSLRKIGAPQNPELALGAVSGTGEIFLNEDLIDHLGISKQSLAHQIQSEKQHAKERFEKFRRGRAPLQLKGRTAILVDDGLATGATMQAAIKTVKAQGAERVIVAVPVAAPDSLEEVKKNADETVCLFTPYFFQAVGEFYDDFRQVEDDEVIQLLQSFRGTP